MSVVRQCVKNWLPPVLANFLRNLRHGGNRFVGPYNSWNEAVRHCDGYHAENIFDKVLEATRKVKSGEAIFERDSVLFHIAEYSLPVVTGLMLGAGISGGNIRVLDFGGSLGSSYYQHRQLIDTLNVQWGVVEQAHYVQAGRQYVQDQNLKFYDTIEQCVHHIRPNIVVLSSVLQYLKNFELIINNVLDIAADIIILDRTIVHYSDMHMLYVQQVPESIYKASYPCWSISKSKLLQYFQKEYVMVAEFQSLPFSELAKISSDFKGYVFRKKL